jgi:hypothetical protein
MTPVELHWWICHSEDKVSGSSTSQTRDGSFDPGMPGLNVQTTWPQISMFCIYEKKVLKIFGTLYLLANFTLSPTRVTSHYSCDAIRNSNLLTLQCTPRVLICIFHRVSSNILFGGCLVLDTPSMNQLFRCCLIPTIWGHVGNSVEYLGMLGVGGGGPWSASLYELCVQDFVVMNSVQGHSLAQ